MADLAQTYRQAIVNYLRGNGAPPAISDIFVDIYNGNPQSGGSSVLNAATGSGTRPSIKSLMSAASAADPSVSSNSSQLQLIAAAVGVVTITHLALFDAATAGNLVMSDALTSGNQVTTIGNPINIPAGAVVIAA